MTDDAGRLTHWEGEPIRVWEALWEVPRLEAWHLLGSTNDRARELAAGGAPPFTVVVAEAQSEGRGRGGRRWHSPEGLGLWISVLLRPCAADAARLASLLVGVAASRAVERVTAGLRARLKWPNDVLLGGRKVAGVLCEATRDGGLVAGVGVNVRQRPGDFPPELRAHAISLEAARGGPVSRGVLAGALLAEMRELLARPPLRLDGALADEVAARDALVGRPVLLEGGAQGLARGIDASGRLRVEVTPGEVRPVVAGSVTALHVEALEGPEA